MRTICKLLGGLSCCFILCSFSPKIAEAYVIYDWHTSDTYSGLGADIGQISAYFLFADYVVEQGFVQLIGYTPDQVHWPEPNAIIDFRLEYTLNDQTTIFTRSNLSIAFDREYAWQEASCANIHFSADRENMYITAGEIFVLTEFYDWYYPDGSNTIAFTLFSNSIYSGFALTHEPSEYFAGSWDRRNDTAPVPEPSTFILLGAGLAGLAAIGFRRKKSI